MKLSASATTAAGSGHKYVDLNPKYPPLNLKLDLDSVALAYALKGRKTCDRSMVEDIYKTREDLIGGGFATLKSSSNFRANESMKVETGVVPATRPSLLTPNIGSRKVFNSIGPNISSGRSGSSSVQNVQSQIRSQQVQQLARNQSRCGSSELHTQSGNAFQKSAQGSRGNNYMEMAAYQTAQHQHAVEAQIMERVVNLESSKRKLDIRDCPGSSNELVNEVKKLKTENSALVNQMRDMMHMYKKELQMLKLENENLKVKLNAAKEIFKNIAIFNGGCMSTTSPNGPGSVPIQGGTNHRACQASSSSFPVNNLKTDKGKAKLNP